MNGQAQRRMAAVLEVLGIYLASDLVTAQLIRLSGVSVTNPLENLSINITGTELIMASRQMFVSEMFGYAGLSCSSSQSTGGTGGEVRRPMASRRLAIPGRRCSWPGSEPPLYRSGWCWVSVWLTISIPARPRRGGRRFLTCLGDGGNFGCFPLS